MNEYASVPKYCLVGELFNMGIQYKRKANLGTSAISKFNAPIKTIFFSNTIDINTKVDRKLSLSRHYDHVASKLFLVTPTNFFATHTHML